MQGIQLCMIYRINRIVWVRNCELRSKYNCPPVIKHCRLTMSIFEHLLENLSFYRGFIADSILFHPQILPCCVTAMGTSIIWVSIHVLSHKIVVQTLFQWIISIPLWILEVLSLSVDLLLGDGKCKKTLSATREFVFNQSMQMFLFSIRMIRYCCPLSCFPQVSGWIQVMHNGISPHFVAQFIYQFLNIGTLYCGYLFLICQRISVFPAERHPKLSYLDLMNIEGILLILSAVIIAVILSRNPFQRFEGFLFGARTVIPAIKFYVRYLEVQLQRMLFLYTINDKLDVERERRKAFKKNVHGICGKKVPKELIHLIFKFDSNDFKMVNVIEAAEMYSFPYYGDDTREHLELHFVETVTQLVHV